MTCLDTGRKLAHTSAKSPAPLAFCRFYPATYQQRITKRESVVVPQSKPLRPGRVLDAVGRDASGEIFSNASDSESSGNVDQSTVLSSLKEMIAAGDRRLDPMLATVADTARLLTGSSGAALAMWKEGAMVCRARSGHTAPPLGARLSAETGISGECLRTGKLQHCVDTEDDPLVDVEVCRSLGLRSIAVLPIHGWRGINGILEVFSTQPAAFTEHHISLLQQLATLAERARASQPHGSSSAAPKPSAGDKPQSSGLLPASDRVGDVALAFIGQQSRPLVLGGIGLAAIALLALVIWLGWRGPEDSDGKTRAAAATVANAATNAAYAATSNSLTAHPPDNDPVWRPNPGGEEMFPSGKPSAGAPVKFASKVDVIAGKKARADRSPLLADLADKVAFPRTGPDSAVALPSAAPPVDQDSVQPMATPGNSTDQSRLNGVLSAKVSLPRLSQPVSEGVSGGQVVRRVPPVYPVQARLLRLEGTVVLTATVLEDGTLSGVKVVEGSPVFAQSAADAVKHWRYKPFQLDGKTVKNEVRINVDFKLPSNDATR